MSRIPQHFIDDLLNRVDIVDVIDHRVKLKKTGKNYAACCPFHKEKTPSFTVSPDKQFYYCFGCGASGTAIGFVMEHDHLGFIDTVESLAKTVGLEVPREKSTSPQKSFQTLYSILEKAKNYYQDQLKSHPQRNLAVDYLRDRGLTGGVAKHFGLGFAPPGWDNLIIKLGLNQEDNQLLEEGGLVIHKEEEQKRYDRFRQRIMFPIIDTRGRTIGFGGRIIGGESGRKEPKYLNSPETPIFFKGRELYGLYQAKQANRNLERLLVVEGYMDVIALAQFNIHYAVATLGTACGEDHLKLAFRHTQEVVFCFDGDNAGRKAARRALENALPIMTDGLQIKFLFLPEGQDPDTLVRQIGRERFEAQIQKALPLEDFFFDALSENIDLRSLDGRARFSKIAAPLLQKLPAGVYKELMFDQLAKRTGLSVDVLMELISGTPQEVESSSHTRPQPNQPSEQDQPPPYQHEAVQISAQTAKPAVFSRPIKPAANSGLVKLNPARLASILLLEQPTLVSQLDASSYENLGDHELPYRTDLKRLEDLLEYLSSRPQASFHGILGYWGGRFGLAAQNELAELVADQFLGSAKKDVQYNPLQELKDALMRIHSEVNKRQREQQLRELMSKPQLSEEEKSLLKALLQKKITNQPNTKEKIGEN